MDGFQSPSLSETSSYDAVSMPTDELQLRQAAINCLEKEIPSGSVRKMVLANRQKRETRALLDSGELEDMGGGRCVEKLGSLLVPAITLGGALAASVLLTIIPLPGVCIAFGMQVLALAVDKVRHIRGTTYFWPKLLDLSLLLCWFGLGITLFELPPEKVGFVRLYAVLMVLGAVIAIFFMSMVVGKPWLFEILSDMVPEEFWRVEDGQSELRRQKQTVFLYLCSCLTAFSIVVASLMFSVNALNLFLNSELDDDYTTITHGNDAVNVILGVISPASLCVLGVLIGPSIARFILSRLQLENDAQILSQQRG